MKRNPQEGSVLISVLLALGLAGFIYVSTSTSFFKTITQQKSKVEIDVLSKSFTNAIFNYTAYAIKERWCMDANWGRDLKCGVGGNSDLKTFVGNPRNLERFLWSKTTLNDMSNRYTATYGIAPVAALGLSRLEQNISINDLETLGVSHPLNLVIDDNIKKCLSSVTVIIEKPLTSYYKSQGDEVYLLITVKGKLNGNPLNRCSLIKQEPTMKGMVIVYPKTLNQYALIKVEDFNVTDYGSSNKGLNFYGPVYVQRNLILPTTGKYGVSFKDKVRIGEGVLKLNGNVYNPETPGGLSNQYLSQISTLNGFFNGISLEGEVDEGLPKLFGDSYVYPTNVNMAMCKSRKDLKDNFSLTKNSRLFLKGSNGNYAFALSESNEFREYIRNGANQSGQYIYNSYLPAFETASSPYVKNQFAVDVKIEPETNKPIMEAYVSVNGNEYAKVLLGRDSEAKIIFGNKEFFEKQKQILDISDTSYLDLTQIDFDGMKIDSSFKSSYNSFKNKCEDAQKHNVSIPECQKVIKENKVVPGVDCDGNTNLAEQIKCKFAEKELKDNKDSYFSKQKELLSNLGDFIGHIPAVTFKTSAILSNKEDVKINWENKDSFKYSFISNIDSIKFRFNVYDFAIEESNNTTSGQRAGKNGRLPGPNDSGSSKENAINYQIIRNVSGAVAAFTAKKNDGTPLDTSSAGKGGILKTESKSFMNPEPPGNQNDSIDYPVDGLSVAEAKDRDAKCNIDTTTLPLASWDVSFTDHTQFSWLYNVTNPGITIVDPAQVKPLPSYTFTSLDMDVGNYQGVPTRSIVENCIVPNSVDMVFGFYVCKTLTVQPRSRPLNMVGTFIVKNLNINPSAINLGVNFYSIWSTGGIELLRKNKHLRREKSSNEACIFKQPGWFSGLDEDTVSDYQSCSPAKFLYQGANNFNWTTVDPEIGITDSTSTQATTQSKIVNRYRRYGSSVIWLRNGAE